MPYAPPPPPYPHDASRGVMTIARQLERQSVLPMESSIPLGMTCDEWRRSRSKRAGAKRRRAARLLAAASRLLWPRPAPCDDFNASTTRYDRERKPPLPPPLPRVRYGEAGPNPAVRATLRASSRSRIPAGDGAYAARPPAGASASPGCVRTGSAWRRRVSSCQTSESCPSAMQSSSHSASSRRSD
jgi:hypothetical protein